MRCQNAERLILASRGLGPEERSKLDAHLARCTRCSDFRVFWLALQGRASNLAPAGAAVRPGREGQAGRPRRTPLRAPARHQRGAGVCLGRLWTAITFLTLGFLIPGCGGFSRIRS